MKKIVDKFVGVRGVRGREGAALCMFYIHKEPRFHSEKSAADTKLEKTSLSAGGFLRVPYGYQSLPWLRFCWLMVSTTANIPKSAYYETAYPAGLPEVRR